MNLDPDKLENLPMVGFNNQIIWRLLIYSDWNDLELFVDYCIWKVTVVK